MKKPIAVFITDTHLFERRSKEDELIENNIELNISLYKQAIDIVKECGLNILYHGGDIFHSRKSQTQTLFKVFQQRILDDIFEKENIDLFAISGNHDKTDYKDYYSFLFPFIDHPRFKLCPYDAAIRMGKTKDGRQINLVTIPFFEDEEYLIRLDSANQRVHAIDDNILLTHIEIKGALTNNGTVTNNGIDPGYFHKYKKVLVGHFHNRNSINEKIHYIGAAYQHNFGEDDQKGVCILYEDLSIEYRNLKFPLYIRYDLNPKDITKQIINSLATQNIVDHVKVVLNGTESEVNSFDRIELKQHGIQVEKNILSVVKEDIDKRIEKFDLATIQTQFDTFVKNKNLDNKAVGQSYLDKALHV